LRLFGHIQRMPLETPLRSGILSCHENIRKGRDRSRLTWEETIKKIEGMKYIQRGCFKYDCLEDDDSCIRIMI
jgi:hypothetical protein